MVAAAYKVMMVAALGSPNGPRKIISLTASDVAGASWLHPSGASEVVLHGTRDVYIIDTILSAAGTDTSQSVFYLNGAQTGTTLLNAASITTCVNRPFQLAPFKVPAGSMLKVIQTA